MEQANRSAIVVLARAGHSAAEIVRLTKLSSSTVYDVYKAFKETGKAERKHHAPRCDAKRTPRFVAGLKRSITANPSTPMTTLAKNRSVSVSTISRSVKNDLHMKSYVRRRRHLLTAKARGMREERCSKLLSYLKHKGASKILVFVDEKKFIVDAEINRQNARVIAVDPSEVPPVFQTKNPASVMVFGAVASDGSVMPPYFIEAGEKLNTVQYISILETALLPWVEKKFGLHNIILIQDSAPCHGAKMTQSFLAEKVPFFIKSDIWPSSSPDLNVLDYFVWGVVQSKVNASPKASVAMLQSSIQQEFRKIDKSDLLEACRRFRARVEDVIKAKGGHIE
jgi:hypothetical protein